MMKKAKYISSRTLPTAFTIQEQSSFSSSTTNSSFEQQSTTTNAILYRPLFFPSKRKFTLNTKILSGNPALYNSNNKFNTKFKDYFAKFENTEVLRVKIKVRKNEYKIFSVRKYDNIFITLETFFKINHISIFLLRPIAISIFNAMSRISAIFNYTLSQKDITYINQLNNI